MFWLGVFISCVVSLTQTGNNIALSQVNSYLGLGHQRAGHLRAIGQEVTDVGEHEFTAHGLVTRTGDDVPRLDSRLHRAESVDIHVMNVSEHEHVVFLSVHKVVFAGTCR